MRSGCLTSFEPIQRARKFGVECRSYKSRTPNLQAGGQIVTELAPGRLSDDEIIVFDSTGVAIEDVAAAALVYERAEKTGAGFIIA